METTEIVLQLPKDLADRARDTGVLENKRLINLIEKEIKRREALAQLRSDIDALRATAEPMSDEEVNALVNAEIKTYHYEKRRQQA